MMKKEWIDPLEELEKKWDLEMANFPSLQPGHFRLSLEFSGESEIHPPSGGMENVLV